MNMVEQPVQEAIASAVAEVRASQRELVAIERTRDIDKSLTYFVEDVIIQLQDAPQQRGKDAMRAIYDQFLNLPWTEMEIESTDTEVAASGDLAFDLGWMIFKFDEGGGPAIMRAKYLSVLRKIDGVWKIVANNVTMDEKYG